MTSLIACIGCDKGTIAHVLGLIKGQTWEKVYLIGESKPSSIPDIENLEFIEIDLNKTLSEIAFEIEKKLKGKILDLEVGFNIVSGSGKLNMAALSAVLKLGLGLRLVALTKEGVKEI
jgi:hypothetical protein